MIGALLAVGGTALAEGPSVASTTPVANCATVTISALDRALGIDAAKVSTVRPAKPHGAVICSYFGLSGRAANEATIGYIPVTRLEFAEIRAALAKSHVITGVKGIKGGAYSFVSSGETFLYVLDGRYQVQLFATRPLGRLKQLGVALPVL